MTTTTNQSIDYYKAKVFLYKYTPEFRRRSQVSDSTLQATSPLYQIDRYEIDLDEKYFTKYDITEYVSAYSFSQELSDNTFTWSVTLQDPVLSFSQINDSLRIEGQRWSTTNLRNLAVYESQAALLTDASFIQQAKLNRGQLETPLQSRLDNKLPKNSGLRLSDLIQPYDVVSFFLYKGKNPVESLTGGIVRDAASGLNVFVPSPTGRTLTAKDLQTESILLSSGLTLSQTGIRLFSNEFIGFVLNKNFNVSVDAVDTVTINGNGTTRLFGATRRVLKSSALQKSIYDTNELPNSEQYTAFQSTYADKPLSQIFTDLFFVCYKINYDKQLRSSSGLLSTSTLVNAQIPPASTFFDVSALKLYNKSQLNMFSIPPFLLALVMKRHGFNYRDIRSTTAFDRLLTEVRKTKPIVIVQSASFEGDQVTDTETVAKISNNTLTIQSSIDTAISRNPSLQLRAGNRSPVFFSDELESLRPYFRFIEDVLKFFNPETKTPYEIIDELKSKTFIEFIERPDGTVLVRPPQYNDTTNVILSSTLDMISNSYSTNVSSLISRQKVGYSLDAVPQFDVLESFAYTDGKLLLQYGQLEGSAESNPNAKNEKLESNALIQARQSGIIAYAEYLLRLHNASLHVGSISCGFDPRIVVGRTFFDERLNKFGYITSVSKSITAGGAVTMSFNLSFVRDAYRSVGVSSFGASATNGVIQFEPLLSLVDVAQGFSKSAIETGVVDPEPPK